MTDRSQPTVIRIVGDRAFEHRAVGDPAEWRDFARRIMAGPSRRAVPLPDEHRRYLARVASRPGASLLTILSLPGSRYAPIPVAEALITIRSLTRNEINLLSPAWAPAAEFSPPPPLVAVRAEAAMLTIALPLGKAVIDGIVEVGAQLAEQIGVALLDEVVDTAIESDDGDPRSA